MTTQAPSATYLYAVLFTYDRGAGEVVNAYTNAARTIVHATLGSLSPLPTLDIEKMVLTGNTEPDEIEVVLRYRDPPIEPIATIADGFPHAPVTVDIYDFLDDDPDNTHTLLYSGRLDQLRIDNRGVARIAVAGARALMQDRPLGLSATTYCGLTFGDENSSLCGIALADIRETATVDSISADEITLTGLTTTAAGYWHRGYVQLGGLRLLIREHTGGATLKMQRPPPSYWASETVILTPGCDKAIETCRTRWDNEARFSGCGIAIPQADPLVSGL